MKNLCIIGNSHVASLKQGWDILTSRVSNVHVTFFASPANTLLGLDLQGEKLVPRNKVLADVLAHISGGKSEIVVPRYTAFLCYGLGLQLPFMDGRLSSAVTTATLREMLNQSLNVRVARLIRSVSSAPVYVGHNPQLAKLNKGEEGVVGQPYATLCDELSKLLEAEHLTLLRQPASSLEEDWRTKPEFSSGSKRLETGLHAPDQLHPKSDRVHMNGAFGEAYIAELLAHLH